MSEKTASIIVIIAAALFVAVSFAGGAAVKINEISRVLESVAH